MGKRLFTSIKQTVKAKSAVCYTDGPGYSDHGGNPDHGNYPAD